MVEILSMAMLQKILKTDDAETTIIIRLMVGTVFLSEGIQKFLFADKLGAGRFAKIGLTHPEFWGAFVGSFEIVCGFFVLLGLLTRLSVIPLFFIMLVAIGTTKSQIFLNNGLWSMLHESRTDWAMLLGTIFLIIKGGGNWSIDRSLWKQ